MGWNKGARNFIFAPDSNWTLIWHLLLRQLEENLHPVFDLRRFEVRRLVSGFCICRAFPHPSSHSSLSSALLVASVASPQAPSCISPPGPGSSMPILGQWLIDWVTHCYILDQRKIFPSQPERPKLCATASADSLQAPCIKYTSKGWGTIVFIIVVLLLGFLLLLWYCHVDPNWGRQEEEDQFPLEPEGQ